MFTPNPASDTSTVMGLVRGNVQPGPSRGAAPALMYSHNNLALPTAMNATYFESKRTVKPSPTNNIDAATTYRRPIPYNHVTVVQQHQQQQQPFRNQHLPPPPPRIPTKIEASAAATPKRAVTYPDVGHDSAQSMNSKAAQASSNLISGPVPG